MRAKASYVFDHKQEERFFFFFVLQERFPLLVCVCVCVCFDRRKNHREIFLRFHFEHLHAERALTGRAWCELANLTVRAWVCLPARVCVNDSQ